MDGEMTARQLDTTLQRLVDLADEALKESKKWLEEGRTIRSRYHSDQGDEAALLMSCAQMSEAWMRVAEYHRETIVAVREARAKAFQREQAANQHDGDV